MVKKVLLITLLLNSLVLKAQSIEWNLTDHDTTVMAGSIVEFHGLIETDTLQVYPCSIRIENVNFPSGWFFTFCNPFYCFAEGVAFSNFNYPDIPNQVFYNDGFGSEMGKIDIHTLIGSTQAVGELDFVFENLETNEVFSSHLIVRTNNQSLSVSDLIENKVSLYPNPIYSEKYISVDINKPFCYSILDQFGTIIEENISIDGNIECFSLSIGIYFLQIHMPNQANSLLRFVKI